MKIHRKLSLLSWRLAMFGEIQSSPEIGLIWGLKLEWNPISVLDNAPCRCNQRNIKLFKYQSTIYIYIYIYNLHRKGRWSIEILSCLGCIRSNLSKCLLIMIRSDLDGLLIKFSINCSLKKFQNWAIIAFINQQQTQVISGCIRSTPLQ